MIHTDNGDNRPSSTAQSDRVSTHAHRLNHTTMATRGTHDAAPASVSVTTMAGGHTTGRRRQPATTPSPETFQPKHSKRFIGIKGFENIAHPVFFVSRAAIGKDGGKSTAEKAFKMPSAVRATKFPETDRCVSGCG